MRRAASWVLAGLAAAALTIAVVALFAQRNVFDADGFADRTDQTLQSPAVSADLARRLSDAAVEAYPDLVAVRPLVTSAAEGVVTSPAFRSLVRAAARDVHRSVFDRDASTVTLTVVDAGVLLNEAIGHLRPDLATRVPYNVRIALTGAAERATVDALDVAERIRVLALVSLLAAVLLGAAAILVAPRRREAVIHVGAAIAAVAGVAALAATLGPRALGDDALRAVAETWLDPLAAWLWGLFGCGLVIALAAGSVLQPVVVLPSLRRAADAVVRTPERPWLRVVRAVAAIALGIAAVVEPLALLEILVAFGGLLLVVYGLSELLRLVGGAPEPRIRVRRRVPRIAALATLLIGGLAVTAFAVGGSPKPVRVGRCNGEAALCDKRLNDVVFVGTHNSMSADNEPGWLFAAQDAGIERQLDDGVRALLVDTHYGFATPRGVATDLDRDSKSREKVVSELGDRFVDTAQQLRTRIGYTGDEPRDIFLCHAFCEVGATRALDAFKGVHEWLLAHPEEVLILSIEDDTDAADTEKLIVDSGLIREVYTGPAKPPWPTLREMIDRDQRVLVLIENEPAAAPWMHKQDEVAQETPYRFNNVAELAAPTTCEPNRGGTKGSLLLVNHWVDTSPAPRKTIAREVNAAGFLGPRLDRCKRERKLEPTIVAVDFYRQGDVFATVKRLNAVTPAG
ncbi:hypothetical protein [Solirubrobacter soli]|uniref:hypothetical protein n=1 Tax=Solirubrobacter soli TaxID=363832 RepID=UPI00041048FF|nr:hypothetical protein [Solirubrobacter soli]